MKARSRRLLPAPHKPTKVPMATAGNAGKHAAHAARFVRKWGQSLTVLEVAFILAYLADPNHERAYRAASGSMNPNSDSVRQAGLRIMGRPKVTQAFSVAIMEKMRPLEISADRTLREIARIAHADVRQLIDADGKFLPPALWPEGVAAAVQALEMGDDGTVTRVRMWSKVEALKVLCEYFDLIAAQRHIHEVHVTHEVVRTLSDEDLSKLTERVRDEATDLLKQLSSGKAHE